MDISVHPSLLGSRLSPSHISIGWICLSLISAWLDMTLALYWGCLSTLGVMTRVLRLLGLKTSVQQDPDEKVSYFHPNSWSGLGAWNPSKYSIPPGAQAHWSFQKFSYKSSHVLSKLLINGNLHITQEILILVFDNNILLNLWTLYCYARELAQYFAAIDFTDQFDKIEANKYLINNFLLDSMFISNWLLHFSFFINDLSCVEEYFL